MNSGIIMKKLFWFIGIYTVSVVVVAGTIFLIKLLMAL